APNSTGGGIKTTTFAVAVLNIVSLARGYSRIEVFRREIADISVKRAFAIICLSVIIIAFGCTLIRWAEPNMSMTEVLFESVSAYTTTGLSLGITPHLSAFSKSVLIGLMFCGRVGALTILIALLNRPRHQSYRYPSEEII
ncbi:TrkH family potassium uptake protein, partial [Salmonella enterica subsp. enterica serovar Virchow]|nr:TrkH family potassium uptake protein [Salmonella enterica subsp. enterica serovar Virchow]